MKTVINARIDQKLKIQLQDMANQMGISLSALISATLTKLAKTRKIELSARTENDFTEEYENEILESLDEDPVFVAETPEDLDNFFKSLK